jgi:hypothetical protein
MNLNGTRTKNKKWTSTELEQKTIKTSPELEPKTSKHTSTKPSTTTKKKTSSESELSMKPNRKRQNLTSPAQSTNMGRKKSAELKKYRKLALTPNSTTKTIEDAKPVGLISTVAPEILQERAARKKSSVMKRIILHSWQSTKVPEIN